MACISSAASANASRPPRTDTSRCVDGQLAVLRVAVLAHAVEVLEREAERIDQLVVALPPQPAVSLSMRSRLVWPGFSAGTGGMLPPAGRARAQDVEVDA